MTAVDIVMQHGMERLLLQGWGGDLLAYGLSHNMGARCSSDLAARLFSPSHEFSYYPNVQK